MNTMGRWARAAAFALLAATIFSLAPAPAAADALDDFRRQGAIAERWDGYVETRPGASAAAEDLVVEVNRRRRDVYEKRATQENVAVSAVGAVYAAQIIKKAPSGTFFRQQDGSYVQN